MKKKTKKERYIYGQINFITTDYDKGDANKMKYPKTILIGGKRVNRRKFREWLMKTTGCNCDYCIEVIRYKQTVNDFIKSQNQSSVKINKFGDAK